MIARQLRLCLAAAALTGLLGGCIAVALPVIAGGLVTRKVVALKRHRPPEEATSGEAVQAGATPAQPGPYDGFARYAFSDSRPRSAAEPRDSVLLEDSGKLNAPKLQLCRNLGFAVVIDLDPDSAGFDPAAPGSALPGLADSLAGLRLAGLTIMWASKLPVEQAQPVYDRLRETGLDPAGTDRLLLQRRTGERKQARLRGAARDYCIIAMAGDRRGDFDELYDYLRDPAYAKALEPLFGAGWFVVPPPIG